MVTQRSVIDIHGFCPACGNATLRVHSEDGLLYCSFGDCPDRDAARKILHDPELHHILVVRQDGIWTVKHPLRERIGGDLFSCETTRLIGDIIDNGGIAAPGRYRVTFDGTEITVGSSF